MKRLLAACVLVSGLGCGAFPPVAVHPDDAPAGRLSPLWQVQLEEHPVLAFVPKELAWPSYANGGQLVLAGSDRGTLTGVDAATGRVRWQFATQGKIRAAPRVVGIHAYLGGMDGKLYKIDARNGNPAGHQWPFETRGAISTQPTVDEKHAYFRNNENRLYAVDAKTGRYAWEVARQRNEELTITGESTPVVHGDLVYCGFDDGVLLAVSRDAGATVWSKSLAGAETKFVDVDTTPVVADGTVYAGSFASGLYALDARTGGVGWWMNARGIQSPAYDGTYLYVTTVDGVLSALDPKTGAPVWQAAFPKAELSPPTLVDDKLLVATGRSVAVVDAGSGRVLARMGADDGQASQAVSANGLVHFVTNSGALIGARLH